jgi:hypothetical protein
MPTPDRGRPGEAVDPSLQLPPPEVCPPCPAQREDLRLCLHQGPGSESEHDHGVPQPPVVGVANLQGAVELAPGQDAAEDQPLADAQRLRRGRWQEAIDP